ncbi:unnamed protein product [Rotaria socialis]|uniref:Uncharacterized protein n=1 Tax=Rotaria socialis TaxID=392032 RepID=A0A821TRF1_9BILA|nr:unnamed protein product [Rotaria socialis]CAF4562153.1 unnamed protein product [Rotaria socialis]CAF4650766.1 unnamed protein product [Rotaria socialis]CAF4875331.1 unnamed protein product [Rotaria socialis]
MSQRISELDTILENRVIDLEHFTKVHANGDMEINYYEEMLNNKAEQMKNSLFNDIESLQQNIRAYRPQNSDSTETRRNYAQLVENSTNALKFTTSKISHIFSRILQRSSVISGSVAKTHTTALKSAIDGKLKPLVLLLLNREKYSRPVSLEQYEEMLENELKDFQVQITHQIDQLQEKVRSCRPKTMADHYPDKTREAYKKLLIFVTAMLDEMRELIKTLFDRHRLFVHQIWQALEVGKNCDGLRRELEADIERHLSRWERYINMIEEKIEIPGDF